MIVNDSKRFPTQARSRLFSRVARLAEKHIDIANQSRIEEFLQHYFKHVENSPLLRRPAAQLAKGLLHQAHLAAHRQPGEFRVDVLTPSIDDDGWEAGGHAVVMCVADDQPWLVDTLTLAATSQGWSIREVVHPQFQVIRDAIGVLKDMAHRHEGKPTQAESWVWMELSPPVGEPVSTLIPALKDAVEASLRDLSAAAAAQEPGHELLLATARWLDEHPSQESDTASAMLSWMADDRFFILGARDFDYPSAPGQPFRPREGGIGIFADDERAAHSFGAVPADESILTITKDSERSRVRRSSYGDYVAVRMSDANGAFERRFVGLFTPAALSQKVSEVPILRLKAAAVAENIGYDADSYGGRAVAAAIEAHPRDELFQASVDQLTEIMEQISEIDDAGSSVTFLRPGNWGRFVTALIYFPRERYNTRVRQAVTELLVKATDAQSVHYSVQLGESPLARIYFTLKVPDGHTVAVDAPRLAQAIEQASRTWDDRFLEIAERLDSAHRGVDYSESYKETYSPMEGIDDLVALNTITDADDMAQIMYIPSPPENGVDFRIKMLRLDSEMVLSRVLPHLSSLGVDVIDERPFDFRLRDREAHIYDFGIRLPGGPERLTGWSHEGRQRFTSALAASYVGIAEPDDLNRLITQTDLSWEQIGVLRAISRYLRQLNTTYSQPYIAATLNRHEHIARRLVDLFEAKFNPVLPGVSDRAQRVEEVRAEICRMVKEISTLDEDRIIRQFVDVIMAMTRTNFYAITPAMRPSGAYHPERPALAFKVEPTAITFIDQPQPSYEIFVYSPRVEGVHLRFGKVARGGIRWSDRAEDYRTEVLGLVRAQMVKNAIIVPVGAKGGFYPLRLDGLSAAERQEEGRAAYSMFIRALLSLTDTIADGEIAHPDNTVIWDDDDAYLVVAADKGTARFSDTANAIAKEQGFWLDDAFASGGSTGYDHKGMGITARGAWVSVTRHLNELGIDPDADDFTVVGIGDMSGDVFGNGMLLSRHIKLVAAFNHQHIFLDPDPDPEASFAERQRLFRLPRSTWADYDPAIISEGGGVFPRTVKSIPITEGIRRILGLEEDVTELQPDQVISAALKAEVDLLWNGGIGTWVKASYQSHAEVGDRANNAVRVDGDQVRARCVGEGGNLGWTQAGRIEYAKAGGLINTDFIDNSAGVDTSDYEVNIKILLAAQEAAGRITREERNELLASMTDEVAQLVLSHNTAQNRALANSMLDVGAHAGLHEELMDSLQARSVIHRQLDCLPSTQEMRERIEAGKGLTCPELCMLLAHVKNDLAVTIVNSDLPDDPYVATRLIQYFPAPVRERFAEHMASHPLAREIITTVAVNRFVDSQGIGAAHRLCQETGAAPEQVIRAQLAARNLVDAGLLETTIARSGVPAHTQRLLRLDVRYLVERATRWLLHEYRDRLVIEEIVDTYKSSLTYVMEHLPELLTTDGWARFDALAEELIAQDVDEDTAYQMASWRIAHLALPIVQIAHRYGCDLHTTARVYFVLNERLGVDQALLACERLPRAGRWEIMARAGLREELMSTQSDLTASALELSEDHSDAETIVDAWWAAHPEAEHIRTRLDEATHTATDLAPITVAVACLRSLTHLDR